MKSSVESQKHSGEGIAALNTDVKTASHIFSNALSPFLTNVIAASFSAIAVFVVDWRMGIGALAVGSLAFFVQSRFSAPLAKLGKERLEANADSVKSISNILAGALAIRAFNRQDRSLFQFDRENGRLKKIAFRQAFIGMCQDLFTTVQGWLTLILVFALGGWMVASGQITFPMIMVVLPLAEAISSAMSNIGSSFAALQPPIVAARRVFEIIDSVPKTDDAPDKINFERGGGYELKINNLSFAYKDAETEALQNINLSVGENKMFAFVGESGSGKSTLLRAVIGMYERGGIEMTVGGLRFNPENVGEWRGRFAYVDQSCKLFDLNISENISMGRQGDASEELIIEAAKQAHAHEFISQLPEGYATPCGEKGASLSGGQKQRLAIARALYRKAPVLVFDEATSALDAESERNIMETINELRSDHTILITTHNLNNIANADLIIVMDGGRVAETGTHGELVAKNGLYVNLLGDSRAAGNK